MAQAEEVVLSFTEKNILESVTRLLIKIGTISIKGITKSDDTSCKECLLISLELEEFVVAEKNPFEN